MTTALVAAQPGEETLEALAAAANREHEEVLRAGRTMVEHAIRAGAALHEARTRVGSGRWQEWVDNNLSITVVPANTYIRVWHYRENLPGDESLSLVDAVKCLRGLPPVTGKNWRLHPDTEAKIELAQELRENEGLTYPQIAERLGVDSGRVWRWLNPERAKQLAGRQYARRKRLMRDAERAQLARDVKGPVSEAYAMTRRLTQVLDQAILEASTPQNKATLRAALAQLYKAEDEISTAIRDEATEHRITN